MAELIIDRNYYNKLDIEGFSKVMSSHSYSYKFYWLEAIVQLISANRTEVTYDEIINKMIVECVVPCPGISYSFKWNLRGGRGER